MAFNRSEIQVDIAPDLNEIFDEKTGGNSFLALRKVRWSEKGQYKLDIRKWYTNAEGEEVAGKGIAFMTEEGPGNLTSALLRNGYCDTQMALNAMKDRPDFYPAVKEIIMKEGVDLDAIEVSTLDSLESETLFYDPKSIL